MQTEKAAAVILMLDEITQKNVILKIYKSFKLAINIILIYSVFTKHIFCVKLFSWHCMDLYEKDKKKQNPCPPRVHKIMSII